MDGFIATCEIRRFQEHKGRLHACTNYLLSRQMASDLAVKCKQAGMESRHGQTVDRKEALTDSEKFTKA